MRPTGGWTRSASAPVREVLQEPRRIGAVEQLDAGTLLALHRRVEQLAEAVVEHRLGARHRRPRDLVEARRPRGDALLEGRGGDDLVDEAVALRPLDVAQRTGQQQLA